MRLFATEVASYLREQSQQLFARDYPRHAKLAAA